MCIAESIRYRPIISMFIVIGNIFNCDVPDVNKVGALFLTVEHLNAGLQPRTVWKFYSPP